MPSKIFPHPQRYSIFNVPKSIFPVLKNVVIFHILKNKILCHEKYPQKIFCICIASKIFFMSSKNFLHILNYRGALKIFPMLSKILYFCMPPPNNLVHLFNIIFFPSKILFEYPQTIFCFLKNFLMSTEKYFSCPHKNIFHVHRKIFFMSSNYFTHVIKSILEDKKIFWMTYVKIFLRLYRYQTRVK